MTQYGTPYYTAASNIGEAINKVYSGWNFTYRGNSEFAAFWLENQFSPGVMMPHTIQGSKIHATEYAILNGNMSSVP